VNLLQIGLMPKSGRLLPTRTTIVAFRPLAENNNFHCLVSYVQFDI
jgi:hypothetical protein